MQISGNTILITGGTSGIGRALAEAFHAEGNQVIITGRRKHLLDEITAANPGMKAAILDVEDSDAIASVAEQLKLDHPDLNVVIHNAGIMRSESLCSLGIPDSLDFRPVLLTMGRRNLSSSGSGGTRETREMLEFCSKHNIVADVEVIAPTAINEAFERLEKGDVHYRFVIDMSTNSTRKPEPPSNVNIGDITS